MTKNNQQVTKSLKELQQELDRIVKQLAKAMQLHNGRQRNIRHTKRA